ncbi:putative cyanobacterial aminoacyl-tRNA synthetase, CAAD domain, protein CURVATURE THYLAKOID 1 [Helianthus annuus]|nr:putative cyanobacterial aminoacyl-tRNA synthetase, CAAD domain, protein CURVATURE THYLAKOID 1 [Helianthus annuus]KAJ0598147.1 putative cyanobacterial aminoacyl-tRNA synthetase, CAAD domain, protein CURVATURE THYLAKOID 1 [Helianthus annuus]
MQSSLLDFKTIKKKNFLKTNKQKEEEIDGVRTAFASAMAATTVYAAATSTSMAVMLPRLPTTTTTPRCSALPSLPARSFSTSIKHASGSKRSNLFQIKVSEDASSAPDANELFNDLKEKWDAVENKSTVIIYGGGAVVAIWLSSIVVGAINSVPLLPKIMELVGLGYSGWFVYRYLLFKSSRKELATDIESIKKKIAGTE